MPMPPLGIIEIIQINIPVHYFASHAISSPLLDIFSCLHDVTANLATSLITFFMQLSHNRASEASQVGRTMMFFSNFSKNLRKKKCSES